MVPQTATHLDAFVTMKLNLIPLALLQPALCARQTVDPAELHLALQSKSLDGWIESIAVKRNISKAAVRSNVQAFTYHLDPVSKHPGPAAGGHHPNLERRQPVVMDYPAVYWNESLNDPMTNNRLSAYHIKCREAYDNPPGSRPTPWYAPSFWRATGGLCRANTARIYCRLPNAFGPRDWNDKLHQNIHETSFPCPKGYECTLFQAHNWFLTRPSQWSGCTEKKKTEKKAMANNIVNWWDKIPAPMSPGTKRDWDIFADGAKVEIEWTFYTGMDNDQLHYSKGPTFMSGTVVQWKGKDPDYRPWLKFGSRGQPATISLYSHI